MNHGNFGAHAYAYDASCRVYRQSLCRINLGRPPMDPYGTRAHVGSHWPAKMHCYVCSMRPGGLITSVGLLGFTSAGSCSPHASSHRRCSSSNLTAAQLTFEERKPLIAHDADAQYIGADTVCIALHMTQQGPLYANRIRGNADGCSRGSRAQENAEFVLAC